MDERLLNYITTNQLMKFYKSLEWRRLRKKALRRDNYECQMCKSEGRYHPAENVHHLKEVKTHPHLALTLDNLQCLCIKCHNEVHNRLELVNKPKFFSEERW